MIIFYSIFYRDGWTTIYPYLKSITSSFQLLINIWIENEDKHKIYRDIKKEYSDALIIFSTNVGKDIGGKLALLDLSLQLNLKADFYIFLHDKKSPHSPFGNVWREKLFAIITQENIQKIEKMFLKQKNLGIVGAKEFIKNEYDRKSENFNSTSNKILKNLIQKYEFTSKKFCFIGGTMFWVRAEVFNNFFLKHPPLSIREGLESGNVLDDQFGTQTHAWERMLTWIAINQGYSIKGI
ncbi:hypothetical protein ESA94_13300 [Lacibacter luteus]|uniref:Glycosyl transferase n=1 Tax=Lacibacter luteus TaxID=2508719 RepID=A0A4Q1CI18_9BACT|nr:rhamnan synthesis F family protein [Lacibacter luteus]RXK60018.1 hypothetical protein ESA94_13300 [Lacibacter luteus]